MPLKTDCDFPTFRWYIIAQKNAAGDFPAEFWILAFDNVPKSSRIEECRSTATNFVWLFCLVVLLSQDCLEGHVPTAGAPHFEWQASAHLGAAVKFGRVLLGTVEIWLQQRCQEWMWGCPKIHHVVKCWFVFFEIPLYLSQSWTMVLPDLPAVYPTNAQFALHFREFCGGYRLGAEAVEVKFPHATATRRINDFSVGITDGFLKTLTMAGIVGIVHQLASRLMFRKHGNLVVHSPFAKIAPSMHRSHFLGSIWGTGTWRHREISHWCGAGELPVDSLCLHTFWCAIPLLFAFFEIPAWVW